LISQHTATCQLCTDNDLSGNQAITVVGVKWILSALAARKNSSLQNHQGISEGNLTWLRQMATGGLQSRHAPLIECMAVFGVLSLMKKAFISIEEQIGD